MYRGIRCSMVVMVLLLLGMLACESTESRSVGRYELKFSDISEVWFVELFEIDCDSEDYPEDASVKIRNDIDRNISLDMNGPSHYEISLGDRRSSTHVIQPGRYCIMGSSPGLRYVPEDICFQFNPHCTYLMTWVKGHEQVKYRP